MIIKILPVILSFLFYPALYAQVPYPFPVKYITIAIDGQAAKMGFMDIIPENNNGQSVLLFHGKNFTGLYWKEVIKDLSAAGYRVIVPDQLGWGISTKPDTKYSFEMLAHNNRLLLDSLGIKKAFVIGHSMGGMLAARFALMYPDRVEKLVLEDPLGLEDYKKFIPYRSMEQQYKKELSATYESYKKYQQGYYPKWKPEYEELVKAQAEPLKQKDFASVAWVYALTYQMIYEQPVLYELEKLGMPVLFIVGAQDRTIPGKDLIPAKKQKLHGNYPVLAKNIAKKIKNSKLVVLPGIGHIPHIQDVNSFTINVLKFIQQQPVTANH
jgi:pimeloyl-ACP methyl ester carboxylesterase